MRKITITEKRASATVFCSLLITEPEHVIIHLNAFGPTQEIRCFAQVLQAENSAELLIHKEEQKADTIAFERVRNIRAEGRLTIIPDLGNGYSGICLCNDSRNVLIGSSREDCLNIFGRILDQEHFAHREWYPKLFAQVREIKPRVGEGIVKCYHYDFTKVPTAVQEMLRWKAVSMPSPTADLVLQVTAKEDPAHV